MKNFFLLLLIATNKFCVAQSDEPTIKKSVAKINEFVPSGWKLIAQAKGDLNKDGLEDVALVIENTNPKNFISNAVQLGGDTLNTNPRCLLIAFKKANGVFELVAKNSAFIPSVSDKDSPCLQDPFGEEGGMSIEKGLLKIYFQHFYSCGAWEIYNFDYVFRYQNQKFELIGYNKSTLHRSTGDETSLTVNFSTLKLDYTSGTNAFKDGGKQKTIWKKITPRKLLEISSITQSAVGTFGY